MKSIVIVEITKRNGAFLSCTGHWGDWSHICICKNQLVYKASVLTRFCDTDVMMTPLSYVCIAVSLT